MSTVDLFLEDEEQQYGNMEEAASVARIPAACLEVWSGDHKQTPGGLKKSKESFGRNSPICARVSHVTQDEQTIQQEEAYARATVAITRASCALSWVLLMKGLIGAATVMGTLMYGWTCVGWTCQFLPARS